MPDILPPKLRILLLTRGLDIGGHEGGAEKFAVTLACNLDPARFEVSIASLFRHGTEAEAAQIARLQAAGVRAVFLAEWRDSKLRGLIEGMPALSKAINSWSPDIVHSHSAMSSILAAGARWRHPNAVFVHTMHASREWGTGPLAALLQQALTRFAFPLCFHAETAVSAQNTQIVNETVVARLRGLSTLRIPNAIDMNELARIPPSGAGRAHGVVGAVGRLDPIKGFDRLINAIPLVKASVPEARFVLVGSGPAGDTLAAQARRLGLGADDVQFVGQQMDIVDWMRRMEILVQPSRAEGLPTVTLEAMALDLPIIASNIPAFREIIQQDWNGRLCAADDPIELARQIVALLGDSELRGRLAVNARETARAYDIRAVTPQYAALYEDLARAGDKPEAGQRP